MRVSSLIAILVVGAAAVLAAAGPKARISLELIARPGMPPGAAQQWHKALSELGLAGVQIRSGNDADKPSVNEQGGSPPSFKVIGILSADALYLPGGKFTLAETGRLRKWMDDLGEGGTEGVTEPRPAFDLTPRQLEEVTQDLKRPVDFSTKGVAVRVAVLQIGQRLKRPLLAPESAERELSSAKVADELKGLSSGTALAAILRPRGLALRPERTGGELAYRVEQASRAREAWPVGWKPRERPSQVLPELFEFLNVEIKETPATEAIEAIAGRLRVPFLYDQNALAFHAIELAKVQVDVPGKRMTYSQVLGKVLFQARAKYEVRTDDADKPFVWITSLKPVK